MRIFDRLPQEVGSFLAMVIVPAAGQLSAAMATRCCSYSLGAELQDDAVQCGREGGGGLRHFDCFT